MLERSRRRGAEGGFLAEAVNFGERNEERLGERLDVGAPGLQELSEAIEDRADLMWRVRRAPTRKAYRMLLFPEAIAVPKSKRGLGLLRQGVACADL